MIVKPILIIGPPRSGTSLLQKILRNHPALWSLPSESDVIWDIHCHPRLHDWKSESLTKADITPEIKSDILKRFERYLCPAHFWKPLERSNLIWGFNRVRLLRKVLRPVYQYVFPVSQMLFSGENTKRIVEKTASNCFRMEFINEIFPDAKIIYPTRDGRNTINSLMNGWLHPDRFFTYNLPVKLNIRGYGYDQWNFVLPPHWRDYINLPLEEVCAFQWQACHQAVQEEIHKPEYVDRVLQIKLEELASDTSYWLKKIVDFVELPYDNYFREIADRLPVINSPDNDISTEKWKQQQHRGEIERIIPRIQPTMQVLGYHE